MIMSLDIDEIIGVSIFIWMYAQAQQIYKVSCKHLFVGLFI